jgi:hypothetical protein
MSLAKFFATCTGTSSGLRAMASVAHHADRLPIPIESGLTSAPRLPHAEQMKRGSKSDNRVSPGHGSPLMVTK